MTRDPDKYCTGPCDTKEHVAAPLPSHHLGPDSVPASVLLAVLTLNREQMSSKRLGYCRLMRGFFKNLLANQKPVGILLSRDIVGDSPDCSVRIKTIKAIQTRSRKKIPRNKTAFYSRHSGGEWEQGLML